MPTRVISIDLVGRNLAGNALRQVGRDSELAAAKSAAAFDASTSRIGGAFSKLGNLGASFGLPFAASLSVVGDKLDSTGAKSKNFGSSLSAIGGVEVLAAAAGIALVGTASVHAAEQYDTAHARLVTATTNVGESFSGLRGEVSQTDERLTKLGFTETDTESSLAALTTASHSLAAATQLEGLAADIARGRHISLADATAILAKVETGRVGLLGRLGINTKDATGKTISQTEAIQRLTDLYGGQATANADKFEGKLQVLGAESDKLQVAIGHALIPQIEHLASGAVSVVGALQDANDATAGLLGKVSLLAAGLPIAAFAFQKVENAGKSVGHMFGTIGSGFGVIQKASSSTATVIAGVGTATENAAVTAARATIAQSKLAEATTLSGVANDRLDAALARSAVAEEGDVVAALEVTKAHDAVTASLGRQMLMAERAAAATAEADLTSAASSTTSAGAQLGVGAGAELAGPVASLGVAAGAVAIPLAGLAAGILIVRNAASKDAEIKGLAADLLKTGDAARKAQTELSQIITPNLPVGQLGRDLQTYGDALLSNADKTKVAAAETTLHGDAIQQEAIKFLGAGRAAHASADELDFYNKHSSEFAAGVSRISGNIDTAKNKLRDLTNQYGAGAIKSAELANAQKQLRDDLMVVATGADTSGAASRRLAGDRTAVGAAGKIVTGVEKQVQAATDGSTDASNRNADAASRQKAAQDALLKSLKALNDDLLASQNADLALAEANNQVGQSLLASTQAINQYKTGSQEATTANFALRHSLLGAVSAAEADAEATDKARIAHGQNVSAIQIENDKHAAAVRELNLLSAQYPQLTGQINQYRASLDLIPQTKHTDVTVTIGAISATGARLPLSAIPVRAQGGPVPGNDPSGIPILAHPHEFVIQAKAVEKYGPKMMEKINAGTADLPKFAVGGMVDNRSTHMTSAATRLGDRTDNRSYAVGGLVGAAGKAGVGIGGEPGAAGHGAAGLAGKPGTAGEPGRAGAGGVAFAQAGSSGAAASAVGAAGKNGLPGKDGAPAVAHAASAIGQAGRPGAPGLPAQPGAPGAPAVGGVTNDNRTSNVDNRSLSSQRFVVGNTRVTQQNSRSAVDNRTSSATQLGADNRSTTASRAGDSSSSVEHSDGRSSSIDNRSFATNTLSADNRQTINMANLPKLALGGPTGSKETLAIVHPREFVMSAKAVDRYGPKAMEQINAATVDIPKFASGGLVGLPNLTVSRPRTTGVNITIPVTIHGPIMGADVGEVVVKSLRDWTRRNGAIPGVHLG